MALSTTFNYDNPSNFTFDSMLISFTSGSAKLIDFLVDAMFQNEMNVTAVGTTLTKTSGANSVWDAKARSVQVLTGDGETHFLSDTGSTCMAGLSDVDGTNSFTDISHAIYLAGGAVAIYENGSLIGAFGSFVNSDVFTVKVSGSTVTYLKNGVSFYTSLLAPIFPLFFVGAFFTVGSAVSGIQLQQHATRFDTTNPTIKTNSYLTTDDLLTFANVVTLPGGAAVQFTIEVAGIQKWWTGSAWADSDGTYAQSNTAATINANLSALDVSLGDRVKFIAFLHSTGTATPTLTSATVTYNFFEEPSPLPDQCTVFVRINDFLNEIPANGKLIVTLPKPFYSNERVVVMDTTSVNFDVAGYAEISVDESATAEANYNFSITYTDSAAKPRSITFKPCQVPDLTDVALTAITTVASVV